MFELIIKNDLKLETIQGISSLGAFYFNSNLIANNNFDNSLKFIIRGKSPI